MGFRRRAASAPARQCLVHSWEPRQSGGRPVPWELPRRLRLENDRRNPDLLSLGRLVVDQWHRTEGVNWWRDEELRVAELEAAVDLYAKVKPEIVLTHDGPDEAVRSLLAGQSAHKELTRTSTGNALNAMLERRTGPGSGSSGTGTPDSAGRSAAPSSAACRSSRWCRIPGTEEQKKIRARAAGRRLADIGGTMPDLPLISRRRPPRE